MLSLQVAAFAGAAVLVPAGLVLLGLGLRRPRAEEPTRTAPPDIGPIARRIRPLVPADHQSTAAEREECRARLGRVYDAQLLVVADILARHPAALRDITMEPGDLPTDDLVTVSAYLHGTPAGLDQALRAGTAEPDRAVVACLVSGLMRFPAHRGACYSYARIADVPLEAYRPGRTIVEPSFLWTTVDAPSAGAGEICFVYWSRTGRPVTALGTGYATVIFTAGTGFQVLAADSGADGGPGLVFLSERRGPPAGDRAHEPVPLGPGQRRLLAQLRRQVATEWTAIARPRLEAGVAPGFDEAGRPYEEKPLRPDRR